MAIRGRLRRWVNLDPRVGGNGAGRYRRTRHCLSPVLWALDAFRDSRTRASLLVAAARASGPGSSRAGRFQRNTAEKLRLRRTERGTAAGPVFRQSLDDKSWRHRDWAPATGGSARFCPRRVSPNNLQRDSGGLCILDLHFSFRNRSCLLGARQLRRGFDADSLFSRLRR